MKTYQTQTISPSRLSPPTHGPVSGHRCVSGAAINGAVDADRNGADRNGADRRRDGRDIFAMGNTATAKGAFWDSHAWSPPI